VIPCQLRAGLVLASLLLAPLVVAADTDADTEVNYLLAFVASSGCEFYRNDNRHDSESAADHLRLKYSRGKRYVDSAEHFIDRLASESSWTGKPYTVNCDGVEEPTADWLHRALDEYRAGRAPG
jgi:hypothetical protein